MEVWIIESRSFLSPKSERLKEPKKGGLGLPEVLVNNVDEFWWKVEGGGWKENSLRAEKLLRSAPLVARSVDSRRRRRSAICWRLRLMPSLRPHKVVMANAYEEAACD